MADGAWIEVMLRTLILGLVCAATALVPSEATPAPAELAVDADPRLLIEQLTLDKAITVARERRLADADQEALYDELDVKDRELRAAESRAAGNEVEIQRVRRQRAAIARQRHALVQALAVQDGELAAQVREYRKAVTEIASSPDPRKRAALQQFADGQQREALAVLDEIADANRKARQAAADAAEAEDRHERAWLTLEARDEGQQTIDEAIERFEELTRLDPGRTWDWVELSWLYEERGRLDAAQTAAQAAHASLDEHGDPRARAAVLGVLGSLAMKSGDLSQARARFEQSLAIARTLAEQHPSPAARRELSIGLDELGEVAVLAGDLEQAKACFEESLAIARALAQADPSAERSRDVAIGLARLGEVAMLAGDLPRAKARYEESLAITRALAKQHRASAQAQRDLALTLVELGDVAAAAGDLRRAKAHYEESLAITRKLAKRDGSARARRDLGIGVERLGDVAMRAGDLRHAKAHFTKRLAIARSLAEEDPSSAEAQRDLLGALARLGRVTGDRGLVEEALGIAGRLRESGRLVPVDRELVDIVATALEPGR